MSTELKLPIKAYLAHPMTGLDAKKLRRRCNRAKRILSQYNIEVVDPMDIEIDVKDTKGPIPNRPDEIGKKAWNEDKKEMRKCDVIINIMPWIKSEGVLRELGYGRFYLWKPIVRVYRPGDDPHMVTVFEDDLVEYSLKEAAIKINENWGTPFKRIKWRLSIYKKSLPRFIYHQILEFLNCFGFRRLIELLLR